LLPLAPQVWPKEQPQEQWPVWTEVQLPTYQQALQVQALPPPAWLPHPHPDEPG